MQQLAKYWCQWHDRGTNCAICNCTKDQTYDDAGMKISMDGKGRWIDNVLIEQFWRTIKYEDIYLQSYSNPNELERGIEKFMLRYNSIRAYDSLGGQTPDVVYLQKLPKVVE